MPRARLSMFLMQHFGIDLEQKARSPYRLPVEGTFLSECAR